MYYVTMTDRFLSGWGMAQDKISKYVIECETYEEAEIVAENAENRTEMKHIKIAKKKPVYNKNTHHTSYVSKATPGVRNWFTPGYFKKN